MKKTKLLALIACLMLALFILTGCSDEESTTTPVTTTGSESSQSSSSSSSSSNSNSGVIEVPMEVLNQYSNVTMKELYISGAGVDNWGDDLLDGQSINPGGSINLTLTVDENNLQWDIKVIDEDGTEIEFRGLDISEVSENGGTITLTADDEGNPIATAE